MSGCAFTLISHAGTRFRMPPQNFDPIRGLVYTDKEEDNINGHLNCLVKHELNPPSKGSVNPFDKGSAIIHFLILS